MEQIFVNPKTFIVFKHEKKRDFFFLLLVTEVPLLLLTRPSVFLAASAGLAVPDRWNVMKQGASQGCLGSSWFALLRSTTAKLRIFH